MTRGALCKIGWAGRGRRAQKIATEQGRADSAPVPTTFNERTPEAAIADAIGGGNPTEEV